MPSNFDVTCAIPRAGRTFENFLLKLKSFEVDSREIDKILEISERSKALSSTDYQEASRFLQYAVQEVPCFGLFVDRKRQSRPYRVGFLARDWVIHGQRVRIEGEEPHNGSSLLKLDEIDCAVIGLDELLTMTQYYLRDPTSVTKWGMYNYHVKQPTDIRIAGSAQLKHYNPLLQQEVQDIVGFFLISKPSSREQPGEVEERALRTQKRKNLHYVRDFLTHLENAGRRVFVKGRYHGVVAAAYPKLKIISVENVEDAVVAAGPGSVGLEVVQTGNTLKRKELLLHGAPLFISESLWVVDYRRYLTSKPLQDFIQFVNPGGYFDEERIQQFALWYLALERNMGDAWINRPVITDLFCDAKDVEKGLRPYRLQTRYWKPDDVYKQEEAIDLVNHSRAKLLEYYHEYQKTLAPKLLLASGS
jgi:hypothetical protein